MVYSFAVLIFSEYEQLTPIYDNVSGTSKRNYRNMVTKYLTYFPISQIVSGKGSRSPFQRQVTILQNAINNWHTLRDNISDPRAETLSQTGVSCSYVLQNMYPFRDIFTIIEKRQFFYSMLNFGNTNSAIVESEMSLHAGQVKKSFCKDK